MGVTERVHAQPSLGRASDPYKLSLPMLLESRLTNTTSLSPIQTHCRNGAGAICQVGCDMGPFLKPLTFPLWWFLGWGRGGAG